MSNQLTTIYHLLTKKEKYRSSKRKRKKDNYPFRKEVSTLAKHLEEKEPE